jgi:coenzyme PQQ precursor peptide PqqA
LRRRLGDAARESGKAASARAAASGMCAARIGLPTAATLRRRNDHVNSRLARGRAKAQDSLREMTMDWSTPTVCEIVVGMEVTSYSSATL